MPELPEVEATRRGLAPHLEGRRLAGAVVRRRDLRWPVPRGLHRRLAGARVQALGRRGKYLLLHLDGDSLILHLGMSGSLRLVPPDAPAGPHDHLDLLLEDGRRLRFNDPRRFGAVLLAAGDGGRHPLLAGLGPEPLGPGFSGAHLHTLARGRRLPVKAFLMDGAVVAGVGNIYACEALHRAGIHPARAAGRIAARRYEALAAAVRRVLREAIRAGGTTLRDFTRADGRPGYFARRLRVYGRAGQACAACGGTVRRLVQGGRASYYCPGCQR